MAVQLHVIYSNIIKGINVIAGGPYQYAEGKITKAIENFMNNGNDIIILYLLETTKYTQNYGYIDNIQNNKIWVLKSIK